MLFIHAELCVSTGSSEMLVFHTLFAGNIGQFGAPGTVVALAGAPRRVAEVCGAADGLAVAALLVKDPALLLVTAPAACGDPPATPPHAAMAVAIMTPAVTRAAWVMNCPVTEPTVASWHGRSLSACQSRHISGARCKTGN